MYTAQMTALKYIILFCMFCGSFGIEKHDSYTKLLNRIEALEQEQRDSRLKVERLEHSVNFQSKVIQSQARQIKLINEELFKTNKLLQQSNRMSTSNNRKITILRQLLFQEAQSKHNQKTDGSVSGMGSLPKQKEQKTQGEDFVDVQRPRSQAWLKKRGAPTGDSSLIKRQERAGISFSVYLDHDLTLGPHQTVKFNQVIINDGNGYNTNTGVFTCLEAGVYMFSFFIGQRSETDGVTAAYAELVINSQNMVDAVVETYHQYQDLQGGNTVIQRLKQGDVVWVGLMLSGHAHIEGSGSLRISTFSGVYLYQ
ncbi:uncharacterized protein LOC123528090 [Mercenaria mercenaria]|uniref:uncharacterized protein LOC123528090 n=1 Tax=Mercenaria mercenaria TaxID=6596 RepID=UPI00234F5EF3|nr:uncharacterized protein LOC123528090 [Mercenaria mercenaria]